VQTSNLYELKQHITAAAETATPEMMRHAWTETSYWLNICDAMNGKHVEIFWQKLSS
jgi:hypothetical protein